MHTLKYLIPEDVRNSLNANPTFQWIVVVVMLAVGILLIFKGIDGIKYKRLTGKYGRVFEGNTARVLGVIYVVLGTFLAVVAIAAKFAL